MHVTKAVVVLLPALFVTVRRTSYVARRAGKRCVGCVSVESGVPSLKFQLEASASLDVFVNAQVSPLHV